jgi:hypothetical protein
LDTLLMTLFGLALLAFSALYFRYPREAYFRFFRATSRSSRQLTEADLDSAKPMVPYVRAVGLGWAAFGIVILVQGIRSIGH